MVPSPAGLSGSLRGRRAIITGGSRGIGAAIARRFAAEGASITLVARDKARLEDVRASLATTVSGDVDGEKLSHSVIAGDVRNNSFWTHLASKMKPVSPILIFMQNDANVLVNAAGVSQRSFLFRTNFDEVRNILDTNLLGTVYGCQVVSKKMMQHRSGCIINIASLLATHAGRGASVYAASKAGIVGLTRSLAWEVGRFGIRVNVILPGYIDTDMTTAMAIDAELQAMIPMGRLGSVEEVADAAEFLATNTYAHNTVLNLDGGLSAT